MTTPHIAANLGDIADTVLMPGDPLRAKFIAEHYLDNVTPFNHVRNMLGFTGSYQGKTVSVMGSGMGIPSMGIYAHELYSHFQVQRIIRIGSCGAYTRALKLFDTFVVSSAWTESTFARFYSGIATQIAYPDHDLTMRLLDASGRSNPPLQRARVHSSDAFYRHRQDDFKEIYRDYSCVAVEMEAFALFHVAEVLRREAACLLTVSDCLESGEQASIQERETAFTQMIELALTSC